MAENEQSENMSGVKFTPGPWRVEEDWRDEVRRHSRDGRTLVGYDIHAEDGTEIVGCEGIRTGGRSCNDARLIAAAPDLYEALAEFVAANEAVQLALCDDPSIPDFVPGELDRAKLRVDVADKAAQAVLLKATGGPSNG